MLLLTVMLVLVSTSAMAKGNVWVWIGTGREHAVDYYLDFQSFHKRGQNVIAWELMDFETPRELDGATGRYLSSKLQMEFDCNHRQSRILSLYMYTGIMGTEDIIYSANFPSAPWKPVITGSVEKELWNSACVKK